MHQYIKVSGTPYERGFQYGSQAKERIRKVIEEYKVLFEKEAFITWDKAYELSKPYRKEIEKYRPESVEAQRSTFLPINAVSALPEPLKGTKFVLIPRSFSAIRCWS